MDCNHDYVFAKKYSKCSKCGYLSHNKSYNRKQRRKITTGIIVALLTIVGIHVYSDMFDISQENLKESLQKIPDQISNDIPASLEISIQEAREKTAVMIKETSKDISNYADDISRPSLTTIQESQDAINYINELREQNGRPAIKWDSRVFSLAGAWSQELYETRQFDHTNPVTGNCPAILKSKHGLTSGEDVADNLSARGYGSAGENPTLSGPAFGGVINGWLESPGHRYNLLFHDHVGGAYACHGESVHLWD